MCVTDSFYLVRITLRMPAAGRRLVSECGGRRGIRAALIHLRCFGWKLFSQSTVSDGGSTADHIGEIFHVNCQRNYKRSLGTVVAAVTRNAEKKLLLLSLETFGKTREKHTLIRHTSARKHKNTRAHAETHCRHTRHDRGGCERTVFYARKSDARR